MNKILTFLLLSALITTHGCSLKEPGTPKWEVEFTVPLADRVYGLAEIIDDSTVIDSSGNWVSNIGDTLYLNFGGDLDTVKVEDNLQSEGIDDVLKAYLGIRTVDSPGADSVSFQPDQLVPGYTIIPPFTIDSTQQDLDPFDEYDWAYLSWGTVTITVRNDLAVPIDILNIVVLNSYGDNNTVIVSLQVTELLNPSDVYISPPMNLPNGPEDIIDNDMSVYISGHSPGSPVNPVTIGIDDAIWVTVELSELGVKSARAHIPVQTFSSDSLYTLEEEDSIRTAQIMEGSVNCTISNNTPVITIATFTLPDFTLNDIPFTYIDTIQALSSITITDFPLEGYEFYRPEQDNLVYGEIVVDIIDTNDPIYPQAPAYVVIDSNQTVEAAFEVSDLVFNHFEGWLSNTVIDIEPQSIAIEDIPGGLDSLDAATANVDLHIINVINGNISVDLVFNAYKGGYIESSFSVPTIQIPAGSEGNPSISDVTVTGLETIVNILPDSIITTGTTTITGQVDIEDTQWTTGDYHMYSPFSLAIGESSLEPEITSIEDGFDDFLNEVHLTLHLENHVPLSGEAIIRASYDSTEFDNPYSTEVDTFFQVVLPQPTLGISGFVSESGLSDVACFLDDNQIAMFAGATEDHPLFVETLVIINSTNGQTVQALSSDYITVGAHATILVDINFEDDEEE
ncbi:hypothetical protein CEE37_04695 [candidate division LCP-89 bacterium B3_LCP]|uniref:Uncharacterized protein n=1 Tax=candidate division LCP-89 bacterium B3_LCP TaxID=2012998 RepID=A0A532V3S9_UNCL8|nr:MAG: hypothetical protein CEE37_04695 [candidate division LCP-89 bacterium B3_LCP]